MLERSRTPQPSSPAATGESLDVRAWSRRRCAGRDYARAPLPTRWLRASDDLATVLSEHADLLRQGDTVAISEKVAVLLTGRAVSMSTVAPSRLARLLARLVRPREGSRGLSVPEKMEYVRGAVGSPRVVAAALASAVTRPLGVHGVFYRIAGDVARDLDGGRPPYEQLLLPPLPAVDAERLCAELEAGLGVGVAVVDLNDFGGSIRAASTRALPARVLFEVLADNPLRQRLTGTPFVIVRPC